MKLRSIGPDKNPRSIGPEPNPYPDQDDLRIGPDRTAGIELLGIGWRGMEAKDSELSNDDALSREVSNWNGAVERGVEVLALREAPEIDLNGVVCGKWVAVGSDRK